MGNEEIPSAHSTPATPKDQKETPATPGTSKAPLFAGLSRKTLLKSCNVKEWNLEVGTLPPVPCSLSSPDQVGAEFIATLILIFAGTAIAIVNQKTQGAETLIGLAAANGTAVMIAILSTGHISGAHLNPSVTIAFAAFKHFQWKNVPVYIGAQILASICAAFASEAIFDPNPIRSGGVTVPSVGNGEAFALEFIISFILMFVVTAVATDTRAVGELAGIAVGATVMLNNLIASNATGASMNPLRTLGPAIAANNYKAIWVYLTAPILGTLCGAGTYTIIKLPEEDGDSQEKSSATRSFRTWSSKPSVNQTNKS